MTPRQARKVLRKWHKRVRRNLCYGCIWRLEYWLRPKWPDGSMPDHRRKCPNVSNAKSWAPRGQMGEFWLSIYPLPDYAQVIPEAPTPEASDAPTHGEYVGGLLYWCIGCKGTVRTQDWAGHADHDQRQEPTPSQSDFETGARWLAAMHPEVTGKPGLPTEHGYVPASGKHHWCIGCQCMVTVESWPLHRSHDSRQEARYMYPRLDFP